MQFLEENVCLRSMGRDEQAASKFLCASHTKHSLESSMHKLLISVGRLQKAELGKVFT